MGATSGKVIRNAMLIASASFAATIPVIPFDVMVLTGSFVGYVALRGISLCRLISCVYKMANPLDRPKLSNGQLYSLLNKARLVTTRRQSIVWSKL